MVPVDMTKLELGVLFAQHDRGALHPGAGLEADQEIFRHDVLAGMFARCRGGLSGVLGDSTPSPGQIQATDGWTEPT